MSSSRLSCPACGQLIGVYEPAVLVTPGGNVVLGSRLTFDDTEPGMRLHEACYQNPSAIGSQAPERPR